MHLNVVTSKNKIAVCDICGSKIQRFFFCFVLIFTINCLSPIKLHRHLPSTCPALCIQMTSHVEGVLCWVTMVTAKIQNFVFVYAFYLCNSGPIHMKDKTPQSSVSSLPSHINKVLIIFSRRCLKIEAICQKRRKDVKLQE